MFNLERTPYFLDPLASAQVSERLDAIGERVAQLRRAGTLAPDTLREFYGEKRFEQVAESNAIEGSTLSVGETELAVLKGITITGHDPAFVKDAVALDRALNRITQLARDRDVATDIEQLHEVHGLLLGDRPGAGLFRRERVAIRGSRHVPPKTWEAVMGEMERWQLWSLENTALPVPMRAVVLHAWLAHIHPYLDGNGRTARAIGNLEFIRAGYPPILIKKKDRDRYLRCLAESDVGDIRAFTDLVLDRLESALLGLEHSVARRMGVGPVVAVVDQRQLRVWETRVRLLASLIELYLSSAVDRVGGTCAVAVFDEPLDLQDYSELCAGRSVPPAWAFVLTVDVPGSPRLEKLAYFGQRSEGMRGFLGEGGPALYWASQHTTGFPKWRGDGSSSPYAVEMTALVGNGDEWLVRLADDSVERLQTNELARRVADAVVGQFLLRP